MFNCTTEYPTQTTEYLQMIIELAGIQAVGYGVGKGVENIRFAKGMSNILVATESVSNTPLRVEK